MNHTATDVIIHTRNPISQAQFEAIAAEVKQIEGVINFDQSPTRPKFITVVYNAGQTRALTILNKLTRLGFDASLVGI
jgi:hypothetical protein